MDMKMKSLMKETIYTVGIGKSVKIKLN